MCWRRKMSQTACSDHDHFTKPQGLMLKAISFYQVAREGRPSPCRFYPSCSHYAVEAIET
ncbi:MAG: membrane protein insertion efficiency factor YidD, partial [Actinobacteria bacterium]|nr:membrane protein insertion efficiency factor YidD [Actinomycetota bacterium]